MQNMHDLQRLRDNLVILMAETGLDSQTKLGKAAGLSQTNMSNIMRMTVQPQLDTLTALAKALKVETWQLLAPPELGRLLRLYSGSNPADREMMLRVAESLSRYQPDESQ